MIKTIANNTIAELEVKKSKFITNIIKIKNEEEARKKINEIRKKYSNAHHNCYAYIVYDNETKMIIEKSSDDKEPSGTAGIPILTVIQKNNLVNVLIKVTRYFGGILLGTGGLVKAYTDSTKNALEESEIVELIYGDILEYELKYDEFEYFKYICEKNNLNILEITYSEIIKAKVKIEKENEQYLEKYKSRILTKNVAL